MNHYIVLKTGQLMTDKFRYPNEKRITVCTSTLIHSDGVKILVDPGWHDELIKSALLEHGLSAKDINIIYFTHLHHDHIRSARLFPNAKWLTHWKEKEIWQNKIADEDADIWDNTLPLKKTLAQDIQVLETLGHTEGHTSVLFVSEGKRILVAGDAVLTQDYYHHNEVHPNSQNRAMAIHTLDMIKGYADVIIPGHDAPFSI